MVSKDYDASIAKISKHFDLDKTDEAKKIGLLNKRVVKQMKYGAEKIVRFFKNITQEKKWISRQEHGANQLKNVIKDMQADLKDTGKKLNVKFENPQNIDETLTKAEKQIDNIQKIIDYLEDKSTKTNSGKISQKDVSAIKGTKEQLQTTVNEARKEVESNKIKNLIEEVDNELNEITPKLKNGEVLENYISKFKKLDEKIILIDNNLKDFKNLTEGKKDLYNKRKEALQESLQNAKFQHFGNQKEKIGKQLEEPELPIEEELFEVDLEESKQPIKKTHVEKKELPVDGKSIHVEKEGLPVEGPIKDAKKEVPDEPKKVEQPKFGQVNEQSIIKNEVKNQFKMMQNKLLEASNLKKIILTTREKSRLMQINRDFDDPSKSLDDILKAIRNFIDDKFPEGRVAGGHVYRKAVDEMEKMGKK